MLLNTGGLYLGENYTLCEGPKSEAVGSGLRLLFSVWPSGEFCQEAGVGDESDRTEAGKCWLLRQCEYLLFVLTEDKVTHTHVSLWRCVCVWCQCVSVNAVITCWSRWFWRKSTSPFSLQQTCSEWKMLLLLLLWSVFRRNLRKTTGN